MSEYIQIDELLNLDTQSPPSPILDHLWVTFGCLCGTPPPPSILTSDNNYCILNIQNKSSVDFT